MWESDALRAGAAGPGRSEDGMSGKKKFSDEGAVAATIGEGPGETRLSYCDPRRSD